MSRLLVDLTPLRTNRNFRLLFSGQFVSLLGSNLTLVAVPYQVYLATHSSLWVGLTSLLQLPFLIAGSLWGGAFGDRFDRRALLILSALVLTFVSAGLGLNARATHPSLAGLLALAALAAGVGGFAGPLRSSAVPSLVAPEELVAAYSLFQVIVNMAAVVGPSVAGVLLAGLGLASCYFIDAATFLALMIATFFMAPIPPAKEATGTKLLAAIANGFRYVRQHATAKAVYLVDLNANVFGLPRALYPAVALSVYHGGPRVLGLLYAAPGVGALVMAVFTGWIARVQRRGRLVLLVVIGWGLAMTLFGAVTIIWVGLVCLALAGAADVISTVLRNTMLQNAITDEFRSRVSSIQLAVVTGGPRLGDLESGAVANFTSTSFSIISGGLACVAGVLILIRRYPHFWRSAEL
ncbi:MAG TPA: MFS transporter [Acidimicrobiales bacterium]|nr:MFS transporter [Acidimicrobiales bacterium]